MPARRFESAAAACATRTADARSAELSAALSALDRAARGGDAIGVSDAAGQAADQGADRARACRHITGSGLVDCACNAINLAACRAGCTALYLALAITRDHAVLCELVDGASDTADVLAVI